MSATYRLAKLIIASVLFVAIEFVSTENVDSKTSQRILVGPNDINANPGDTVQFPCVVLREPDAIVTWCWNDFCTLGKTQLVRYETNNDGTRTSIHQFTAYPRFSLSINEQHHHYNLSIAHVSTKDEGIFQCQVQRTMRAHEARSARVHLTLIAHPNGQPVLVLPNMPLRQGRPANLTCLSSPSKPASILKLFKHDQMLPLESSSTTILYELDPISRKNLTKLIYTIVNPDSSWNDAQLRCEQTYALVSNFRRDVSTRIQVQYKPRARIESQNRHPLIVNSTATFRCIVQGNPEPQFRWFANSMDLTSLTSSIINIPLSKHVHNHTIGCTAMNSIGTTNTSIRLLIRYPPILVARPPRFVVLNFDNPPSSAPVLRCVVDSFPRARISWLRHGHIIGEGSMFHLENITTREQQGIYTYRVEADGFEPVVNDVIVYVKGKPLIYIHDSTRRSTFSSVREFECKAYSASPILRIAWRLNDQVIESNEQSSISTVCDEISCTSKLLYDRRRLAIPSTNTFNRLSCIGENELGSEQSRLYQIDALDDTSTILVPIVFGIFLLLVVLSIVAICCGCRARHRRKRHERSMKKLPIVYDAHYSINELVKEVACVNASSRTCNTSLNDGDQLSLRIEQSRIEPTDRLLTAMFHNSNAKKLMDNLSNESSTNSSGFHSKSTTTTFNQEYSPRLAEAAEYNFSGISPLYTSQYQMNV